MQLGELSQIIKSNKSKIPANNGENFKKVVKIYNYSHHSELTTCVLLQQRIMKYLVAAKFSLNSTFLMKKVKTQIKLKS